MHYIRVHIIVIAKLRFGEKSEGGVTLPRFKVAYLKKIVNCLFYPKNKVSLV